MYFFVKIFSSFVFLANAVVILNEKRFLSKIGLPLSSDARHVLGSTRLKIVDLLRAFRTVIEIPLIMANVIFIVYELLFG